MKRRFMIAAAMLASLLAGSVSAYAQEETERETEEVLTVAEYGWDSLKKAGRIQEKGGVEIATVSLHFKYFGDVSIDDIRERDDFEFLRVQMTPDHFVEYEMTKDQFEQYIDYQNEKVEHYFQMITEDEKLHITDIRHDPSFSTFTCTVDGDWDNVGIGEKIYSLKSYAQMYDMILGTDLYEDIVLIYYDSEGNYITTRRESMVETNSD